MYVTNSTIRQQLESQLRHLVACFNGVGLYPLDRRTARYAEILAQLLQVRVGLARCHDRALRKHLDTLAPNSPEFRATLEQLRQVRLRLLRYEARQVAASPLPVN